MRPESQLFISYATEDATAVLVAFLADHANRFFDVVHFDKNVRPGESFTTFMDNISTTQVVLVCCTPRYKAKAMRREGGVVYEFDRIINKLMDYLEARRRENVDSPKTLEYQRFQVIPILLSGTPEESIPDELTKLNIRYVDLRFVRPITDRRGGGLIPDRARKEAERMLFEAFRPSQSLAISSTRSFNESVGSRLKEFFAQRKGTGPMPDGREGIPNEIFVKTFAYERVKDQRVLFLVGRKGSGKSTVAQHIQLTEGERYKRPVIIHADSFPLNALFAWFRNDLRLKSDMELLKGHAHFMQLTWDLFVILSIILVLTEHSDEDLSEDQCKAIPPLRGFRKSLPEHLSQSGSVVDGYAADAMGSSIEAPGTLFAYAFKCSADLLNEAIGKSTGDDRFLSQILSSVSSRSFLTRILGAEVLESVAQVTSRCEKRILLTLDGFDNVFQEFRGKSFLAVDELRERVLFELSWLRGLLHLVIDIKEHKSKHPIYGLLDFCFTVPRDRFHEVLCLDRDSFRYDDKYSDLDWSGYELCIMLRKRVERVGGISVKALVDHGKDLEPQDLMDEAFRRVFPEVPLELDFSFNGKTYHRPLFLYVLRHSFWRPRDILIYYSRIIELARATSRRRDQVTSEMLRVLIGNTTSSIINSEFINEYQGFVRNLPDILQRFKLAPNVLSYEEVGRRLANVEFQVLQGFNPFDTLQDRVEFLYQIGFLGIRLTHAQQERVCARCRDVFYFSEGTSLLVSDGEEHLREFEFVIHPIFSEFLFLSNSGGDLAFDLTWNDIKTLDRLRPVMSSRIVLRRKNNILQQDGPQANSVSA